MRRKVIKAASVTQSNDASSIGNKRGMARRAKKQSHHSARQFLSKEQKKDEEDLPGEGVAGR